MKNFRKIAEQTSSAVDDTNKYAACMPNPLPRCHGFTQPCSICVFFPPLSFPAYANTLACICTDSRPSPVHTHTPHAQHAHHIHNTQTHTPHAHLSNTDTEQTACTPHNTHNTTHTPHTTLTCTNTHILTPTPSHPLLHTILTILVGGIS